VRKIVLIKSIPLCGYL